MRVREEEEGEAAVDGGWVKIRDREGEERREAGDGVARRGGGGGGAEEPDGVGVEGAASARVGDGEVASEADGAVGEVSVAEQLEAAEGEGAEVEVG